MGLYSGFNKAIGETQNAETSTVSEEIVKRAVRAAKPNDCAVNAGAAPVVIIDALAQIHALTVWDGTASEFARWFLQRSLNGAQNAQTVVICFDTRSLMQKGLKDAELAKRDCEREKLPDPEASRRALINDNVFPNFKQLLADREARVWAWAWLGEQILLLTKYESFELIVHGHNEGLPRKAIRGVVETMDDISTECLIGEADFKMIWWRAWFNEKDANLNVLVRTVDTDLWALLMAHSPRKEGTAATYLRLGAGVHETTWRIDAFARSLVKDRIWPMDFAALLATQSTDYSGRLYCRSCPCTWQKLLQHAPESLRAAEGSDAKPRIVLVRKNTVLINLRNAHNAAARAVNAPNGTKRRKTHVGYANTNNKQVFQPNLPNMTPETTARFAQALAVWAKANDAIPLRIEASFCGSKIPSVIHCTEV